MANVFVQADEEKYLIEKVIPRLETIVHVMLPSLLHQAIADELEKVLQRGTAKIGQDVIVGLLRKGLEEAEKK
jgi:hypothetical protein